MRYYKIHDEFSQLTNFTCSLPETFEHIGWIVQDHRNVIKKVIVSDVTLIIKYFKGMYFFNRLAYSFIKKSKAERSYMYSRLLQEKGVITPPQVAWIDCYHFGLLTHSYFISVYSPYQTMKEVLEFYNRNDPSLKWPLYHHLAAFAFRLHQLGIYHNDFSLTNILVIPTLEGYEFSLVDLNRIRLRKVGHRKGLHNFARFGLPSEDMNVLVEEYAKLSGEPAATSLSLFWIDKKRASFLREVRVQIRNYTIKPLKKLIACM